MSLISGIHHVAMKCCDEKEYNDEKKFYGEILGLPVKREWNSGIMFDTGSGIIEIFNNGDQPLEQGVIRHFAFAVYDVDLCVKTVREAGYKITVEPKDVVIPSSKPFPIRVAFCLGPLGEEIEFFQEK